MSFTPTGAMAAGGVRLRTPPPIQTNQTPIRVIAEVIREGLLNMQNHLIFEFRKGNLSATRTEVLIRTQEQRIETLRELIEETRNYAWHAHQAALRTGRTAQGASEQITDLN